MENTKNSVGFTDAIRICLKEKYATFEGRASRSEFLYYFLFFCLVMIAYSILFGLAVVYTSGLTAKAVIVLGLIISMVFYILLLIPYMAVCVRRLHDTGKSGTWFFVSLIPYVGPAVLFVLAVWDPEKQDNEYGPY